MSQNLIHPASFWHNEVDKSGINRVVCDLCPRNCSLQDGQRGFCFVRKNTNGVLDLTTYGRSTGFCIDPIEKKPLNHFLPGTPILSFGTAGCNLGCKFCQNWDISKSKQIEILSSYANPETIVKKALELGCRSLAFTYNDPIIWAEYAIETAKIARENGIKTVAVTAAYISNLAREEFFSHMDAANVDLKAFSERFYKKLTLSELQPVLDNLIWLKKESNTWFELTNLMIPNENDSEAEISEMCDWILNNLGDDVPIHFTAFHPDYKLLDHSSTPSETLQRAREQALNAGIKYAYVGNVHDKDGQSTYCSSCKKVLIERDWYQLGEFNIKDGACVFCSTKIPGVFEDEVGTWGAKREPIFISEKLPTKTDFNEAEKQSILSYVKEVIREKLLNLNPPNIGLSFELANSLIYGVFVTLKRGDILRACKGGWGDENGSVLIDLLREVSIDSATTDPRFPSIKKSELDSLTYEVSIMYAPQFIEDKGEEKLNGFEIGEHGIVLNSPRGRALFLPNVATENNWDKLTFVTQLCRKARVPDSDWIQDDVNIMTFKTVKFESLPNSEEVYFDSLTTDQLHQLFNLVDALDGKNSGQVVLDPIFAQKSLSNIGLQVDYFSGEKSVKLGSNKNVIELLQEAVEDLKKIRLEKGIVKDGVAQIILLSRELEIDYFDYPNRQGTIFNEAVLVKSEEGGFLTLPTEDRSGDPILYTFAASGLNVEDWINKKVSVIAYSVKGIRRNSLNQGIKLRASAFSGTFYPEHELEINAMMREYFSRFSNAEKNNFPAIMLPHAGWKYCGEVMARTLSQVNIPTEVIIIGPKHTSEGSVWSVAPEDYWEIPGSRIQIISEFRNFITSNVPKMEADSNAHLHEHGVEVILPYLKYLQPDLRILPIAIGGGTGEELAHLSYVLSEIYKGYKKINNKAPLFIISSDMNHFESDEISRSKDQKAIEELKKVEPYSLLKICIDNSISMCGALPAVIVMQALRYVFSELKGDLVDYQNSGLVTGDLNSVVGYAGMVFQGEE